MQTPVLTPELLTRMNAYWRAANYLSVGQIYPQIRAEGAYLKQIVQDELIEHKLYVDRHGEDMPEIRHWQWPGNVKNAKTIKPPAELETAHDG
jgi:xylulose-5-phosphate/fructose-6-phosphate phosphoketolase